MYNEPSKKVEKRRNKPSEGDLSRGIAKIGNAAAKQIGGENAQNMEIQDPDDEPEQPQLTIFVALLTLGVSTALVAVCAEFMVSLTRSSFLNVVIWILNVSILYFASWLMGYIVLG